MSKKRDWNVERRVALCCNSRCWEGCYNTNCSLAPSNLGFVLTRSPVRDYHEEESRLARCANLSRGDKSRAVPSITAGPRVSLDDWPIAAESGSDGRDLQESILQWHSRCWVVAVVSSQASKVSFAINSRTRGKQTTKSMSRKMFPLSTITYRPYMHNTTTIPITSGIMTNQECKQGEMGMVPWSLQGADRT